VPRPKHGTMHFYLGRANPFGWSCYVPFFPDVP
jgi:hypothetical protein